MLLRSGRGRTRSDRKKCSETFNKPPEATDQQHNKKAQTSIACLKC